MNRHFYNKICLKFLDIIFLNIFQRGFNMKIFEKLKSFFSRKKIRFDVKLPLKIDELNEVLSFDTDNLSALLCSDDIINKNNKFEISSNHDDEKTEIADLVVAFDITKEKEVLSITKMTRRLTLYRNTSGRLVNVVLGPVVVRNIEL